MALCDILEIANINGCDVIADSGMVRKEKREGKLAQQTKFPRPFYL